MAWKPSVFLQGVRGVGLRLLRHSIQGHVPARVWGFESPLRHHAALNGHRSECTRSVRLSSGVFREYRSPLRRRVRTCLRPRHPLQAGLASSLCRGVDRGRRQLKPPRHVVVCGAGVMGASVGYFLALRGVAVTLVERRIDGMKRLASLDVVA
jgi:FAD dependent oxidoreductase